MVESMFCDLILSQMSDMLFVMSVGTKQEFRYLKMNPAAMRVSGLNEYAYNATFHDVVDPEEAEILRFQYMKAFLARKPVSFVLEHEGQIGESYLNPIIGRNGKISYITAIVRDITGDYYQQEDLKWQAHRDALTGLLNRHGLVDWLKRSNRGAKGTFEFYNVFLIDVDNLKTINDTYGHLVGDLYLQNVAERLRHRLGHEDLVSRIGGDEFIVLTKVASEIETQVMAERMMQAFVTPWVHQGCTHPVSVSMGVTRCPIDGLNIWDAIDVADRAMYQAKGKGGQRYEIHR